MVSDRRWLKRSKIHGSQPAALIVSMESTVWVVVAVSAMSVASARDCRIRRRRSSTVLASTEPTMVTSPTSASTQFRVATTIVKIVIATTSFMAMGTNSPLNSE